MISESMMLTSWNIKLGVHTWYSISTVDGPIIFANHLTTPFFGLAKKGKKIKNPCLGQDTLAMQVASLQT